MEEGTGGGADSQARHSGRAKTQSEDGGGDWRRGRLTFYAQWKGQDKVRRWRREREEGQTHKLGTMQRPRQGQKMEELKEGQTHKLSIVEGPRQGQKMEEGTGGGADSHARYSGRAKTRSADGGGDWRTGRLTG